MIDPQHEAVASIYREIYGVDWYDLKSRRPNTNGAEYLCYDPTQSPDQMILMWDAEERVFYSSESWEDWDCDTGEFEIRPLTIHHQHVTHWKPKPKNP